MSRPLILSALLAVALPVGAEDLVQGERLFMDHCATCHGTGAKGDGPMAAVLSVAPADLTGLSARNAGVFPVSRVIRRIDGTTEVLAHGGPMPIFGLLFKGPSEAILAPDGSEVIAPERIVDVVSWLESLQEGS